MNTSDMGWTPRGDDYHWDHEDGCFIEKDFCAGRNTFVLYSADCARLASVRSLAMAYLKHAELHAEEGAAK